MAADHPAARSLASKLVLPAVPPTTLARSGTESRLEEPLERRLTLVIAGAGFGKSTLVASWAARQHCAWYTLSPEDRAPLPLADGLARAIPLREPRFPDELIPLDVARGPEAEADAAAPGCADAATCWRDRRSPPRVHGRRGR